MKALIQKGYKNVTIFSQHLEKTEVQLQ